MKQKLTITSPVEAKKTKKDKPFYTFNAKGDDGGELSYSTFSQTIGAALVQGVTYEVEFEISTREYDGNTYTDRRVNQVWVDGKPIREEKKQYNRGKSPEDIASMERTSLWRGFCDIKSSGISLPDDVENGILDIARKMIRSQIETSTPKLERTASVESFSKEKQPEPIATINPPEEVIINTLGDLFTFCLKKWKMNQSQVLKELGVTEPKQIKNIATAYLQIKAVKEVK